MTVFQIWFDGVTALGAMLAFQMRGFVKNDEKAFAAPQDVPPNVLPNILVFVWLIIWLITGIPYWFAMFFFSLAVFDADFWKISLFDFGVIAAVFLALVSNVIEESKRGYERMSNDEIRLEFNWQFSMHLARISAVIFAAFLLRLGLIAALALALSYIEIYPMRTLRFMGGDSTLDAENENRSRD